MLPHVETTPDERVRCQVGINDRPLMAWLLRKAGYEVREPGLAQDGWRDPATAPRSMRVLIGHRSGTVEIAAQWNVWPEEIKAKDYMGVPGWHWFGDDRGQLDPKDTEIDGWLPLPPGALPMRADCPCECHAVGGIGHARPCCRGLAEPVAPPVPAPCP